MPNISRGSQVKKPLGKPTHGWKNNIKLEFRKVGCDGVGYTEFD
jgi:hypothetical protein